MLVLHKGKLLADGTPAAVAQSLGGGTLEEAFSRTDRVHRRRYYEFTDKTGDMHDITAHSWRPSRRWR